MKSVHIMLGCLLLSTSLLFSPANATAQGQPVASEPHRSAVVDGLEELHDHFHEQRLVEGVSSVASGVILAGLGGAMLRATLIADDDSDGLLAFGLLGVAATTVGLTQLVLGIISVTTPTAQERTALMLVSTPALHDTAGLMFLEGQAWQARRDRRLTAAALIVSGAGMGLMAIPLSQDPIFSDSSILVTALAIATIPSIGLGLYTFMFESAPERIYRKTLEAVHPGRSITALSLAPAMLPTAEGKFAPGLSLGGRW